MARLATLLRPQLRASLALLKFNPDQPRDEHGRWGEGGYGEHFADNLGIVRGDMPQIPNGAMKDKFLQELADKGIGHTRETVMASELKATQSTFNAENINYLRGVAAGKYTGNPILVANDNRVLDGHHRWVGAKIEGQPIDTIKIDLPAHELVATAREFSARNGIAARKFWTVLTLTKEFNPSQPRDANGRWGDGDGGHGTKDQAVVHRSAGVMSPSTFLPKTLLDHVDKITAGFVEDRVRLTPEQAERATADLAHSVAGAHADKPAYDQKLAAIAEAVGGRPIFAPVKGGDRLLEKHVQENKTADMPHGDAALMRDLVRGSVVVGTHEEAEKVLSAVRNHFEVTRVKDRFAKPDPTGYRDVLVNVRLPSGIQGEIQIHIPEMLAAKDVGHKLYEVSRSLPPGSPRAPALMRLQQQIYGAAWKANRRKG